MDKMRIRDWWSVLAIAVTIGLFGYAALSQSTQHGINVTWNQGTCPVACTITKNSVYRSTTGSTGTYTKIFDSTTPITSYLDPVTTANQGTQACYEVTAWTTIESPLSSPVCQTFPVQAGAPSSVSATQQ